VGHGSQGGVGSGRLRACSHGLGEAPVGAPAGLPAVEHLDDDDDEEEEGETGGAVGAKDDESIQRSAAGTVHLCFPPSILAAADGCTCGVCPHAYVRVVPSCNTEPLNARMA